MSAYTDAVARGLEGLHAVSTGPCPGCAECASAHGFDPESPASMTAFRAAWQSCEVESESHFSWRACGICGSTLGGDRERWHALDTDNALLHFDDACTDCVMYLANGDEPERWGWNGKGGTADE